MSTVSKTSTRSGIAWGSTGITLVVVAVGLVAFFALLNLIIEGRCDIRCMGDTLGQTLRYATPIAFAALCGLLSERSGVVNIGIEGKMLMAAMVAYMVNLFSFQALKDVLDPASVGTVTRLLALVAALLSAMLLALLHAVVSIHFKTDQIISGTVINILAIGITGYIYRQYLATDIPPGPGTFAVVRFPDPSALPLIGPWLAQFVWPIIQQKPLTYTMLILLVVVNWVLFFTPWGLRTLAVGENPKAADTLGVDVFRIRYTNVLLGGAVAGLGGAWFTLEAVDVFNPLMTNGLGFIGLAAMIFGKWTPFGAFLGACIFGLGTSVTATISIFRPDIPAQIPQMLPYVLTIIVLAGAVGRASPPAAVGTPYEKQ